MASIVLTIKGTGITGLKQHSSCDHIAIADIVNHLNSLASGNEKGTVYAQSGTANPVAASATFTVVSAVATDAVTIGTIVMTATSTPTTDLHWEIDGADDDADAASLCAAINANPTLTQIVTATVADNVVTVTAKQRGVVGNAINFSSADATITASTTHLAGGTGGATDAESAYAFGA